MVLLSNIAGTVCAAADWNNNRRNTAVYGAYGIKAVRTVFAGFILLAISNALLILTVGTEPAVDDHSARTTAPVTSGPMGVQSTRTLGASTALLAGQAQTVV